MDNMIKDFVWGVATASAQIEGGAFEDGKGLSNWDVIPTIDGATYQGQDVSVASDHFNHLEEDLDLLCELGVKAYRFSLSWARIIPDGIGNINKKGLEFYDRLVDGLLKRGIEPFVTLFHWDLPFELYKKGAWLNKESSDWFLYYVSVVAKHFDGRIKHYITFNEPQCILSGSGGVVQGGKYSNKELLEMVHNILLSHGKATKLLHTYKDVKVGFAPCCVPIVPLTNSKDDIDAARKAMFTYHKGSIWDITIWSDPVILGKYPDEYIKEYNDFEKPIINDGDMELISTPIDFYCQNIYTANYAKSDENGGFLIVNAPVGNAQTCMGWDVIPEALYWGPKFLYERYNRPFYITENGCAITDLVSKDGKVHDAPRIEFLKSYIENYQKAIEDGVDGRGYFVWSFMDNFEWGSAYSKRFGLVYIDYPNNCKRIKKDSFEFYKELIKNN